MIFDFCVIEGQASYDIIHHHHKEVFSLIQDTYLTHELGKTVNPQSYFFRIPEKPSARIIALPSAIMGDEKVVGMKWIGSNPENIEAHFPRASAAIILNDYKTFYPYACLEGSIISAVRTAYSGVVAATCIKGKQKRIKKLSIVGNGLIAKYIYKAFMSENWDIGEIILFDQSPEQSEKWVSYVEMGRHEAIHIASSVEEGVRQADMIILTTSALQPYIHDFSLFKHNPIVLNISLRDLAPAILLKANNIVDDIEHVLQANTSPHLAYQMCGDHHFISGTVGRFIQHNILLDHNKPTIFSPMGLGILDLALAHFIYKIAILENRVISIPNFFFDIER